jgi:hypothetical protein
MTIMILNAIDAAAARGELSYHTARKAKAERQATLGANRMPFQTTPPAEPRTIGENEIVNSRMTLEQALAIKLAYVDKPERLSTQGVVAYGEATQMIERVAQEWIRLNVR